MRHEPDQPFVPSGTETKEEKTMTVELNATWQRGMLALCATGIIGTGVCLMLMLAYWPKAKTEEFKADNYRQAFVLGVQHARAALFEEILSTGTLNPNNTTNLAERIWNERVAKEMNK